MPKVKARSAPSVSPIDLPGSPPHSVPRFVVATGIALLLILTPLFRGLFFPEEQLVALLATVALVIIWCFYTLREVQQGLAISPRNAQPSAPLTMSAMDWAAVAVVLSYFISLFFGVKIRDAVQEFIKYSTYLAIYWLTSRLIRRTEDAFGVLQVLTLSGALVSLIGIAVVTGTMSYNAAVLGGRLSSVFQYPNSLASYVSAAFITGLILWSRAEKTSEKMIWAIAGYLSLFAFILTDSRGAWLVFPIGLALLVLLLPASLRWKAATNFAGTVVSVGLTAPLFSPYLKDPGHGKALVIPLLGIAVVVIAVLVLESYWRLPAKQRRIIGLSCLSLAVIGLVAAGFLLSRGASNGSAQGLLGRLTATKLTDHNILERFQFSKDAFKIIKAYPVFGVGGGGWSSIYFSYQTYGYSSTLVHNNFMQVWVETGTIGFVAFLSLWGLAVIRGMHLAREGEELSRTLATGTLVPAILLGMHSTIDFSLSLASISFAVWALLGTVRGLELAQVGNGWPSKGRDGKLASGPRPLGKDPATVLMIIAGISMVLGGLAASILTGYYFGQRGARALNADQLDEARAQFERAISLDPFTATYHIDLATTYERLARSRKDDSLMTKAFDHIQAGLERDRFNPVWTDAFGAFMLRNGRINEGITAIERMGELRPAYGITYEKLAQGYFAVGEFLVKNGQTNEGKAYLAKVPGLENRMREKRREAPAFAYPEQVVPETTPLVQLLSGKSFALLGDSTRAVQYLLAAAASPIQEGEARLWLGAIYRRQGDAARAQAELDRAFQLNPGLKGNLDRVVETLKVAQGRQ